MIEIETIPGGLAALQQAVLPRLRGHVFHVTSGAAFARIQKTGALLPNTSARYPFTSPQSVNSFGRRRGYICLMDLRNASNLAIEDTLDRFYFLDPFTTTRVNVFLLLREDAWHRVIPNNVGRVYSPKETVIPEREVWYPGRLPLDQIRTVLRVPIKRPGKWAYINREALKELMREKRKETRNHDG